MRGSDRSEAIEWARNLLADGNFVVLDTETTGLNRNRDDEPVAIAVVGCDGVVLVDTLVKPSIPIDEGAESIHGISDEMIKDALGWWTLRPKLEQVIQGKTVVIYNAAYDTAILRNADALSDADLPGIDAIAAAWECAMKRYAAFWGDWNESHHSYRWQRLTAACAQQEIEVQAKPHSALGDCLRTLEVIKAMAKAEIDARD